MFSNSKFWRVSIDSLFFPLTGIQRCPPPRAWESWPPWEVSPLPSWPHQEPTRDLRGETSIPAHAHIPSRSLPRPPRDVVPLGGSAPLSLSQGPTVPTANFLAAGRRALPSPRSRVTCDRFIAGAPRCLPGRIPRLFFLWLRTCRPGFDRMVDKRMMVEGSLRAMTLEILPCR